MSEEENMNQNEEEMDEEILINQEDGEGQDMYAFEIEINGEPYIIIIGKTDENKIFLRLMDKEDQAKPFFQNEFSLDDLRILNPIFNNIDSEDLAFQYLASNLNDAEKDLKIIDEEKINFNMIITDEDEKIELDFVLYKTIDEGNGENEIMENPENVEIKMIISLRILKKRKAKELLTENKILLRMKLMLMLMKLKIQKKKIWKKRN